MAVVVSPNLIYGHVKDSKVLLRAWELLESDNEIQETIKMANIMAVGRLKYNDHGVIHSRIVAGSALEILNLLLESGIKPTTLAFGTARNVEEVKLIVLLAAYLHDIGNAVHRVNHEHLGVLLAGNILDRILPEIMTNRGKLRCYLKYEVMHAIYATESSTNALTMEAGAVKIADGTDMAEGRARIPYKLGKLDMHAVSAISIKQVLINKGENVPVRIDIVMNDYAGLFQVEEVLKPKIMTSGLADYIEVYIRVGEKVQKIVPYSPHTQ